MHIAVSVQLLLGFFRMQSSASAGVSVGSLWGVDAPHHTQSHSLHARIPIKPTQDILGIAQITSSNSKKPNVKKRNNGGNRAKANKVWRLTELYQ